MNAMRFKRGEIPGKRLSSDKLTVAEMCNRFPERVESRTKSGEIKQRHLNGRLQACGGLLIYVGKFFRAASV